MERIGLISDYHRGLYNRLFPPKLPAVIPEWEPPIHLIPEDQEYYIEYPIKEAYRLMDHPQALTYMCLLQPDLLEKKYPRILDGIYIPDWIPNPSPATADMLKYFGAKNSDDLIRRTKNIVRAVLDKAPKHSVDNIFTALDFMDDLHGEETRNTGEKKICHEARTLLRTLIQIIDYHETTLVLSDTYYPRGYHPTDALSPFNQAKTATRLTGLVMHDSREDYFDNEIAHLGSDFSKGPPYVISLQYRGSNRYLIFDTQTEAESIPYFIDALTNREMDETLYDGAHITKENMYRLLERIWDLGFTRSTKSLRETINNGKIADREDNTATLWKHKRTGPKGDSYFQKLEENMISLFPFLAKSTWMNRHCTEIDNNLGYVYKEIHGLTWLVNYINDVPLTTAITLLKLLGANDNDIFGWATGGECKRVMETLEKEGEEPLLIPSPTQADILTKSGKRIIITRNGNLNVAEAVREMYYPTWFTK